MTPIFKLIPFEENHGQLVCAWRYPAPYHIYDLKPWQQMTAAGEEFADPQLRKEQYRAVANERGELCGFAQFFPIVGVSRLGLGLRPDLCGRGYGEPFVRTIVQEARRLKPGNEIDLEVYTWNVRARRVYERAGFVVTDTYERMTPVGMGQFHCMVWSGETGGKH
ncbi:GNAT family N-acetyltransferase [Paenibacillus ginsengihumi]|uniref:GNAT family N-acetyltransferase n=1 Tax=Paenibacillus ginsengihumi TaxID=431596 RepID=UPI00035D123D